MTPIVQPGLAACSSRRCTGGGDVVAAVLAATTTRTALPEPLPGGAPDGATGPMVGRCRSRRITGRGW